MRGQIEVGTAEDQIQGIKDLVTYLKEVGVKFNTALEVGVWLGASVHEWADHFETVYCVDHWLGDSYVPNVYERFLQNKTDNMIPLRMFSTIAARRFEDKSLDFVYIDADHRGHGVMEDIYNWLPKVKTGGVIAGHDYGRGNEGHFDFTSLTQAVDSVLVKPDIVFRDTSWAKQLLK